MNNEKPSVEPEGPRRVSCGRENIMIYAGFCETCGVLYYEADRLAHQHKTASPVVSTSPARRPNVLYCDGCGAEMSSLVLSACQCGSTTFSGTMSAQAVAVSPSGPDFKFLLSDLLNNRACICGGWTCPRCIISVNESAEALEREVPELTAAQPVAANLLQYLVKAAQACNALGREQGMDIDFEPILGPFFTQVSQPPTEASQVNHELVKAAIAWLQEFTTLRIRREWSENAHDLSLLEQQAFMCAAFAQTILAAPVTPVSGNGTEPVTVTELSKAIHLFHCHSGDNKASVCPCHIFGAHATEGCDCKEEIDCVAEMLRKHLEAGAASHNGQGWVRVEDRLPENGGFVLVCEEGTPENPANVGKRVVTCADYSKREPRWQNLTDGKPISNERYWKAIAWKPLPAPPSEADGPQGK